MLTVYTVLVWVGYLALVAYSVLFVMGDRPSEIYDIVFYGLAFLSTPLLVLTGRMADEFALRWHLRRKFTIAAIAGIYILWAIGAMQAILIRYPDAGRMIAGPFMLFGQITGAIIVGGYLLLSHDRAKRLRTVNARLVGKSANKASMNP